VSAITYVRTVEGFSYLSLITDAYSSKVVGYSLHPTLEAKGCILALSMALRSRKPTTEYALIHHSDPGIQYCSADYVALLEGRQIAISMTQAVLMTTHLLSESMASSRQSFVYKKFIKPIRKQKRRSFGPSPITTPSGLMLVWTT
jgi:hypothetical protein